MTQKQNGDEPLLPGLRVPEPPADLRRQVLTRAGQALGREPRVDLWARLWESRQARLAWAASVLALVVGHLVTPTGDAGTAAADRSMLAQSGTPDTHEELADIADLPRLSLDGRPMAAPIDLDGAAPPALPEENAS